MHLSLLLASCTNMIPIKYDTNKSVSLFTIYMVLVIFFQLVVKAILNVFFVSVFYLFIYWIVLN